MRTLLRGTILGAVSALALTAGVEAKTLVYCSEGSPEGFNPQLFTTGTTFDAASSRSTTAWSSSSAAPPRSCPAWPRAGPSPPTA